MSSAGATAALSGGIEAEGEVWEMEALLLGALPARTTRTGLPCWGRAFAGGVFDLEAERLEAVRLEAELLAFRGTGFLLMTL